jgi:hypothetical protein
MLIANPVQPRNAAHEFECLAMQTSTRGGLSETDVNELAVIPRGSPAASMVVTIVTPVTKVPRARLNSSVSIKPRAAVSLGCGASGV